MSTSCRISDSLSSMRATSVCRTNHFFDISEGTGRRTLIVGIYRPTGVALGRDGERQPLLPVIHEFERQLGLIEVDMPQAGGRQFVKSLLDTEPNRLGTQFRQALYGRTEGHALCTVEMLRNMQERGALVQDEACRWVEGSAADWASLPARCEGMVGKRIDRLPVALRETLKVASVEGEEFTAEIVAQVLGAAEVEIVGQLSGELARRHRLVVSQGSQRLSPDGQRASQYRFRHILFKTTCTTAWTRRNVPTCARASAITHQRRYTVGEQFSVALPAVDHQRGRCYHVPGYILRKQCGPGHMRCPTFGKIFLPTSSAKK